MLQTIIFTYYIYIIYCIRRWDPNQSLFRVRTIRFGPMLLGFKNSVICNNCINNNCNINLIL